MKILLYQAFIDVQNLLTAKLVDSEFNFAWAEEKSSLLRTVKLGTTIYLSLLIRNLLIKSIRYANKV